MTVREEFLDLLRAAAAQQLRGVDRAILDALKDGDDADLPVLRADRQRLRSLPDTIAGTDRAALVAQWPGDFPPLPQWFADPESIGPLGAPCVVECGPPPAPEPNAEPDAIVPPDLAAQILFVRRAKAVDEDRLRAEGIVDGRQVMPADLGLAG